MIPHETFSREICYPTCLFSQEGRDRFLSQPRPKCVYCYSDIGSDHFEKIQVSTTTLDLSFFDRPHIVPTSNSSNNNYAVGVGSTPFTGDGSSSGSSLGSSSGSSLGSSSGSSLGSSSVSSSGASPVRKIVLLKAPPGSGKSTLVNALEIAAVERGETVTIVSVDRNVIKMGGNYMQVIKAAMQQTAIDMQSGFYKKSNWIIVDTCGANGNKIFGVKKNVLEANGYDIVTITPTIGEEQVGDHKFLSWCLKNVLSRTQVGGTVTLTGNLPINNIMIPYDRSIANFPSNIQQNYKQWKNKFMGISDKKQILNIINNDAESFVPKDIDSQIASLM